MPNKHAAARWDRPPHLTMSVCLSFVRSLISPSQSSRTEVTHSTGDCRAKVYRQAFPGDIPGKLTGQGGLKIGEG